MEPTTPPRPPGEQTAGGRDLRVAVASGLTLAAIFLITLFAHPVALLVFIAALVVVALFELDIAFRGAGLRPATPIVVGSGLVAIGGSYFHGPSAQSLSLVLLVLGTLAWVLLDAGQPTRRSRPEGTSAPDASHRAAARRRGVVPSVGATFLLMLWVPFLASFLALLLARPDGQWLVLAVVALSAASDIGAYFVGTRFGRHKLAASVSPAKTWEGAGGGAVTAFAVAALILAHFPGLDLVTALVLAGGIALASTVGDLTESLIKRELGVKDLGRIVPGHGGIMDRADAVIFSLPAAHLLLVALGA